MLVGKVRDSTSLGSFRYDLEVHVPSLNNYIYSLLFILHEITLYPVRLRCALASGANSSCDDEAEFVQALREILSSEDVRAILSRLRSQAS